MRMRSTSVAAVVVACCSAQALSCAASDASLEKIIPILRRGGFSSSTDSGAKLSHVGDIRFGRVAYEIYFYNHTNIHPTGDPHGVQKLVIIENGRKYIGSYVVNAEPVRVVGREVKFKPLFESGGECPGGMQVARSGPPKRAAACGELITIEQ